MGDVFSVVIDMDDPSTFFLSPDFENITVASVGSGTVTVVPEPSAFLMAATSGLGLAALGLTRRPRRARS